MTSLSKGKEKIVKKSIFNWGNKSPELEKRVTASHASNSSSPKKNNFDEVVKPSDNSADLTSYFQNVTMRTSSPPNNPYGDRVGLLLQLDPSPEPLVDNNNSPVKSSITSRFAFSPSPELIHPHKKASRSRTSSPTSPSRTSPFRTTRSGRTSPLVQEFTRSDPINMASLTSLLEYHHNSVTASTRSLIDINLSYVNSKLDELIGEVTSLRREVANQTSTEDSAATVRQLQRELARERGKRMEEARLHEEELGILYKRFDDL